MTCLLPISLKFRNKFLNFPNNSGNPKELAPTLLDQRGVVQYAFVIVYCFNDSYIYSYCFSMIENSSPKADMNQILAI